MSSKFRQSFYYLTTIISGFLGIALLYGGISADGANSVSELVAGLAGLLGATGPALAAAKTREQRVTGVLDSDPAAQVANALKQVNDQANAARAQAEAVKAVLSNVVDDVPVLGPLAADVLSKVKF